jgi:hypothetical protein
VLHLLTLCGYVRVPGMHGQSADSAGGPTGPHSHGRATFPQYSQDKVR